MSDTTAIIISSIIFIIIVGGFILAVHKHGEWF
jgi:hypothetical protein